MFDQRKTLDFCLKMRYTYNIKNGCSARFFYFLEAVQEIISL